MASNQYVNKVNCDGNVLIDLTGDTVTASSLARGYTAHDASGAIIVGTATVGDYDIAVDPESIVGNVQTGTAVTAAPNYTPTGDIRMTTQMVDVPVSLSLNYTYSNYVLTITGITAETSTVTIPTAMSFDGSPVRLEIIERNQ